MNGHLAFAACCVLFSACNRHAADIEVPVNPTQTLSFPRGDSNGYRMIIDIDKHGKRVMNERGYDSDDTLRKEMAEYRAKWPSAEVCIHADRRASYESISRIILMARDTKYQGVSLFLGLAGDGPQERVVVDSLKLRYDE